MPSYRDVEMLNRSLQGLGDSLLQERMIQMQQKDRTDEKDFRNRQAGFHERQAGEAKAHRDRQLTLQETQAGDTKAWRAEVLKDKQTQQAMAQLQQQIDRVAGDFEKGLITKDKANQQLQDLARSIFGGSQLLLSETGLARMLDENGDYFSEKAPKPAPSLTPVQIGGRPAVLTPGGALHREDELSPVDREELRNINRALAKIDDETRALAKLPDAGQARVLNTQRSLLEEQKQGILAKYQGGAEKNKGEEVAAPTGPKPGDVLRGYEFLGGDPAKPASWRKR